ncbi:hypothetical protein HKD37_16G046290 [Glycine soja]
MDQDHTTIFSSTEDQIFRNKKLRTPLPRGSSLCEGMGEGYCTQPYPCICKEAVSGFEPMTNKSPRHNFTAAPGLALKIKSLEILTKN